MDNNEETTTILENTTSTEIITTVPSIFGPEPYNDDLYANVVQCMRLNTAIKQCNNQLEMAKSSLPVAIIFTVLLTAAFVCLVCFLSAFTIFCVKERKRKHRKRRRRARKHRKRMARIAAIVAAGGQVPVDGGELAVELDPTKNVGGAAQGAQAASGPGFGPGGPGTADAGFKFGGKFGTGGGVGASGVDDEDSSEEKEKEKEKKNKKKGGFAGMFGALVDGGDDDSDKKDKKDPTAKDNKDPTANENKDPTANEKKDEKKEGQGGVFGFMKKLAANLNADDEEFAEPEAAGSVAEMKTDAGEEDGTKYVQAKDRFEANAPANEQGAEGGQAAGNPVVASSPLAPAGQNAGNHSAYA